MEKDLYREMYELELYHWWFRARRRIVRKFICLYMRNTSRPRFLDVGCGTGAMLKELEVLGEAVGMDASDEALAFARARTQARLIKGNVPEDLYDFEEEFDFVLMLDLLEHLDDDLEALKSVSSVLRANGALLITVPAFQFLYTQRDRYHHHRRRYRKSSLRRLMLEADLDIEYLSYYNFFLYPPAAARRVLSGLFDSKPGRDLALQPPSFNRVLEFVFAAERFFLPRVSFPWGLSIISVARPKRPGGT